MISCRGNAATRSAVVGGGLLGELWKEGWHVCCHYDTAEQDHGNQTERGLLELFPNTPVISLDSVDKCIQSDQWRVTQNATRFAGGNIEFLPDGTPLLGKNLPKDIIAWFRRQKGEVVAIDSGWTSTGDLDEILLLTKDPRGKRSCLLFYADLMAGSQVLMNTFKEIEKTDALAKLPDDTRKYYTASFKKWIAGQTNISQAAKVISTDISAIMAHPSMKNCESVALPAAYYEEDESSSGTGLQNRFFSISTSPLNSLVIGTHVFMLDPSEEKDPVKEIMERYGFTVHFYQPSGFDGGGGYMHCSTNTVRKMPF